MPSKTNQQSAPVVDIRPRAALSKVALDAEVPIDGSVTRRFNVDDLRKLIHVAASN